MLNREQVTQVEAAQRAGCSIRATAREFGFDRSTVRLIFHGKHPLQLGRPPSKQGFPVRRFLIAFAEIIGPLGLDLRTQDQRSRYERIRARRERQLPQTPAEMTGQDEDEPIDSSCSYCGYPLILEWAYNVHGAKHLVVVADGHVVGACPHCKRRLRVIQSSTSAVNF